MSVVVATLERFSMTDPLSRAMADLAAKEREMKDLEAEIARLKSFIAMYRGYAAHIDAKRSKKDIIGDAAEELIREAGTPIPLSELYEAIERRGIEIGTSNPKQYLSTTLNRDDRFISLEGKGWSLTHKR